MAVISTNGKQGGHLPAQLLLSAHAQEAAAGLLNRHVAADQGLLPFANTLSLISCCQHLMIIIIITLSCLVLD